MWYFMLRIIRNSGKVMHTTVDMLSDDYMNAMLLLQCDRTRSP